MTGSTMLGLDEVPAIPDNRASMLGDCRDSWSNRQGWILLVYLEQLVDMVSNEGPTMVCLSLHMEGIKGL